MQRGDAEATRRDRQPRTSGRPREGTFLGPNGGAAAPPPRLARAAKLTDHGAPRADGPAARSKPELVAYKPQGSRAQNEAPGPLSSADRAAPRPLLEQPNSAPPFGVSPEQRHTTPV
ncbi:hypothetical protein DIPPA_01999 [Diplonema papillatum]|nr:hypothetical protein DIPPA_01999 [Diplonema papillatum]